MPYYIVACSKSMGKAYVMYTANKNLTLHLARIRDALKRTPKPRSILAKVKALWEQPDFYLGYAREIRELTMEAVRARALEIAGRFEGGEVLGSTGAFRPPKPSEVFTPLAHSLPRTP